MITENGSIFPKQDQTILALGDELQELFVQIQRADAVSLETNDKDVELRCSKIHRNSTARMDAICHSLSAFKATTAQAAAVQMRALANLSSYDELDRDEFFRLVDSILGVLENSGGFARACWAGDYWFPLTKFFDALEPQVA